MKSYILTSMVVSSSLFANTQIGFNYNIKDYSNSKTKINGISKDYILNQKFDMNSIFLNYEKSKVDRENKILNKDIESLNVEKFSLKHNYIVNEKLKLKWSFINIDDNLAPTDNGKIYGLGINYNFNKKYFIKVDHYLSDYDTLNVNQTDLLLGNKLKLNNLSLVFKTGLKHISLNGKKYGNYTFDDNYYNAFLLGLNAKYESYNFNATYMKGDRIFTVLADGLKVQHHAMRQDDTYFLSIGKKYKNFLFSVNYSYQKGTEVPENQDNVKTKVTSLQLKYKF